QWLRSVHLVHPIALTPHSPVRLARFATHRRIRCVTRNGKYVLLVLHRSLLTLHFRLDGQLLCFSSPNEFLERANQPKDGVHVDVAFEFGTGVLGFADRRHFGRVHAWESIENSTGLSSLGVDGLSKDFTVARFRELLSASVRPLTDFLMVQNRVAGLGNNYSRESLRH